ncbi:MAG: aminoglycoside phosphotransferase family protein [Oscillospiraceae bacterium]|nr:aminoglycoside phosphotransferase family protein [Oscillospiraceae bacterium]
MQELLQAFDINAAVIGTEQLSGGCIHKTIRIRTTKGDLIAQELHPTAFPDLEALMHKLISVTDYLRKNAPDCVTLHFYAARDGSYLHNGWRLADCISGTVRNDRSPETAYAAGKAFGTFQSVLRDYPPIKEPPFHDPAKRFAELEAAASAAVGQTERELLSRLHRLRQPACFLSEQALPFHTVHNDTKISNLLFSKKSDLPTVIDLDTVGTGLAAYDFGDAVRSLHGRSEQLDRSILKAFTGGFLEGAAHLTPEERDLLPFGIVSVSAELAARYLTDHLTGNHYFHRPDSLSRAAQLTALAESTAARL